MRLPVGGRDLDRSRPLRFTFDGRPLEGFACDTLASALLANDVAVVGPSPILGRPRGITSAGVEESTAFVEVLAPWFDPIVAAPAVPLVEGLVANPRPGTGRLDPDRPPLRGLHRSIHVETLVVGGGLSGLRAAAAAADRGDRVLLCDERLAFGGTSLPFADAEGAGPEAREALVARLRGAPDVTLLSDTTATGIYDQGSAVLEERGTSDRRVVWHVRAGRVILATGAHERPIAFAGNDRPGVMFASAARTYVERHGVLPGRRAVLFTTNDAGLASAAVLRDAGAELVAVADARAGAVVVGTEGDPRLTTVLVRDADGAERRVEADLLLVAGGWNPTLQLLRTVGGGLRFDEERSAFVPDGTGPAWLEVVGGAAGDGIAPAPALWWVPGDDLTTHFVDLQRDETVADVLEAVGDGLRSVEHVKRATYIGTALDQGRTSGALTAGIVNAALGAGAGAQGPTNARPPYTPVPFSVLAGPFRGNLIDPVRTTVIHPWHVARGAVFEDVGQWKRPWAFPLPGEDPDDAVARECEAVRTAAGALDASTLGKIEVVGPDAATFLDRIYANRMSTLRVGRIRYGLMLGLDGMVMDDGVAMRLADDRYVVTTTTGGAARVLDHLEEWLQTEWTDLCVYCTSVTEQWAVVALAGPRSREVLAAAGADLDLDDDAFPPMAFRDATVAGLPVRVARVSFTGERSYELHVTADRGLALWEAVFAAGADLGIAPYGTEAMHVLRAEKGFVIVGQETDGTVTPDDLGLGGMVDLGKGDFVGRRSLARTDTARPGRKQLVGLLPVDPSALIPEGAQIVLEDTGRVPMPMIGHVTSSYRSPALGRTFALAMLAGGRDLLGRTVRAPLPDGTIDAVVTAPVFLDPEGARVRG
ncbi:MAG: glycine cleavage T C-terminal barrel domain-containing protein [Actinomycetota bacterium]